VLTSKKEKVGRKSCECPLEQLNFSCCWWVRTGFDLLVAAVLALGVMCLGAMGAFSLVFLPPWVASSLSPSRRLALITGSVLSVVAYAFAFTLPIVFDQPFGPAMVFVLCAMALLVQVATVVRRKTGR